MEPILIAIFYIFLFQAIHAQEDKIVTLSVTGNGNTIEEAKTNAQFPAIEQTFGAFISSKTEILNDVLVKDEIVSISKGHIQNFDIISEIETPKGDFVTTLSAVLSITNLIKFVESKGYSIEL